jgi:anti-sigma factor RsiW
VTYKDPNSKHEMHCDVVQESVLARLDNDPDEAVWSKVEKHLLSCRECAEFAENSILLNARLRDELKDDRDTGSLWSRITVALDGETQKKTAAQAVETSGKKQSRMLVFGAVAAVMFISIFTFSPQQNRNTQNTPLTVTESINDFLTFRASGRELDINSSEPQELRRWLVKRLYFEAPLSVATPAGFKLVGVRLCSFLNRRPAAFVYHMDDKVVSLYVMTETGLDSILEQVPRSNELSVFSSRGLTSVVWRRDGLLYVVVADFPETEAVNFARSVGKSVDNLSREITSLQSNQPGHELRISAGVQKFAQLFETANSSAQSPATNGLTGERGS